ncbi:MAG: hypothetical protein HZB91_11960 [Elusimicrobia bacterium]|nr:hypothetical protein [Elusimicrobiota bacterium]
MTWLWAGLLCAGALALYAPALNCPILDSESFNIILTHAAFRHWDSLSSLLTPDYFAVFGEGGYRPLTSLAYFAAYQVSGTDPLGYRLLKFVLHAGNSFLVFSMAARLIEDRRWALLSSGVYFFSLLSPVFQGMASLPDILAAAFCLAAVRVHASFQQGPAAAYPSRWMVPLVLAAMSAKEMYVLLPAVLLAYDCLIPANGPPLTKELARRHLPIWAAVALYLAWMRWWIHAERFYGPIAWAWPDPWWLPGSMLFDYAAMLLVPPGLDPVGTTAAVVILLALETAVLRRLGKPTALPWRGLAFLAAWAALALAPVVYAFPLPRFSGYFMGADPHNLAFAGAALLCLPAYLARRSENRPLTKLLLALLLAAVLATRVRDSLAQARAGCAWLPTDGRAELLSMAALPPAAGEHPMIETWLGRSLVSLPLLRRKDPSSSAEFEAALRTSLPAADAEMLLWFYGQEAIHTDSEQARRTMRLMMARGLHELRSWHHAELSYREGSALLHAGSFQAALPALKSAWKLDPSHYPACYSVARALLGVKDAPKAWLQAAACEELWRAALERGTAETTHRRTDETLASQALLARGDGLCRERRYPEALEAYRETASTIDFTWPEHWAALREARFLAAGARQAHDQAMDAFQAGEADLALQGFTKAISLDPGFGPAYASRAALRAGKGQKAAALRDCEKALRQPMSAKLRALVLSTKASLGR